jgi:2-keto-4-pentenoate hydratase/2-oxohepta-3-ene-1,7-dioic acid hydratase in catechol pathway
VRLATLDVGGATVPAAAVDDRWRRAGNGVHTLLDVVKRGLTGSCGCGEELPADSRLRAPLIPGKIVAIGLNYLDHICETGTDAPERPLVFAKFPSSVIGPDEEIVVDPQLSTRVDWEVELGVVIGRRARNVAAGKRSTLSLVTPWRTMSRRAMSSSLTGNGCARKALTASVQSGPGS